MEVQHRMSLLHLVMNDENINVYRQHVEILARGQRGGKRDIVVAQRRTSFLDDVLEAVDLVLGLVLVEHHVDDVVLGQGVALPSLKLRTLKIKHILNLSEFELLFELRALKES